MSRGTAPESMNRSVHTLHPSVRRLTCRRWAHSSLKPPLRFSSIALSLAVFPFLLLAGTLRLNPALTLLPAGTFRSGPALALLGVGPQILPGDRVEEPQLAKTVPRFPLFSPADSDPAPHSVFAPPQAAAALPTGLPAEPRPPASARSSRPSARSKARSEVLPHPPAPHRASASPSPPSPALSPRPPPARNPARVRPLPRSGSCGGANRPRPAPPSHPAPQRARLPPTR